MNQRREKERDYGQGRGLGGYLEPDDQSGNSIGFICITPELSGT